MRQSCDRELLTVLHTDQDARGLLARPGTPSTRYRLAWPNDLRGRPLMSSEASLDFRRIYSHPRLLAGIHSIGHPREAPARPAPRART